MVFKGLIVFIYLFFKKPQKATFPYPPLVAKVCVICPHGNATPCGQLSKIPYFALLGNTQIFMIKMNCQFNFRFQSLILSLTDLTVNATFPRPHIGPMGKFKNGCCLFSKYFSFASDVYKCDKHLFFSISATTVRLLIKSYLKTLCQRPWRRIYVVSEK